MSFADLGIEPAAGIETADFIVRPITVADAELDYEAVMESREFLRIWEQSSWPEDDFGVEGNRKDMEKMVRRHQNREAFGYTVMNPTQTECLGCVYFTSPSADWFAGAQATPVGDDDWADCDAMVSFWVRESRLAEGLDRILLDALVSWLDREWSFGFAVITTVEGFTQQVQMIEGSMLERRFEITLPKHTSRTVAYA